MDEIARELSPREQRRAERTWGALVDLARRDGDSTLVCVTTGQIAQGAGDSVDTVRRALDDLARVGRVRPTGLRQGKARQYRLVASPQPQVGSPQLELVSASQPAAAEGTPLGGSSSAAQTSAAVDPDELSAAEAYDGRDRGSAVRRVNAGSGWDPEDKRRFVEWEPDPERFDDPSFVTAQRWFREITAGEGVDLEQLDAGDCDDCGRDAQYRQRVGRFAVCRGCAGRRLAAGLKVASEIAAAAPPNEHSWPDVTRSLPARRAPVSPLAAQGLM